MTLREGQRRNVALATTWESSDPALLERIVPLVDCLEIPPDSIAASDGHRTYLRAEALDEIAGVAPRVKLAVHGIGLSMASFDRWNEDYIRLLDEFFGRFTPEWHSEHLGYTTVAGENIGTMLPPDRTDEMLDLLCERIARIQRRYRVPFLVENIVNLLPCDDFPYTQAGFLNAIAGCTGCGLLLDVRNIECDARNFGFDTGAFLDELDLAPVREIHIAGGTLHEGFDLDVHSRPTADSTLELARDVIRRAPNLETVTYEFMKEAIPALTHDGICDELRRLRAALHL
ncbi:MAG: DUF692 family protein [Acidobacteriota bacterium]|nr:DUF692 family protein [Acidobacteriota bacterium]